MVRFGFILTAGALLATAAAAEELRLPPGADESGARWLAQTMDVNRDGVISRAEFRRHNVDRARWRALDRNDDGVLDATEQDGGLRPGPRAIR